MAQDAQLALEALVPRYDEGKEKKDQLKAWIKKLTSIIIKVTNPSKSIEPVASTLDE